MEALLVTGGEAPPCSRLEKRLPGFGLVCAADSGLDTLIAWGRGPDIIVGDMDSISDLGRLSLFPRSRIIRASRDKDLTDTEMGVEALAEAGADRIVLAGGGGGRLDHLLAVRALFERKVLRPAEWHTAHEAVFLIRSGEALGLEAERGALVSVFPLAEGASGMASEGLKWPLAGLSWGPGDCGVSNEAPEGRFEVTAGRGDLLVLLGNLT
jgi:thiamine pyrophosphokinase